jgi:uncharacterized protein (AIM24 family)
MITHEIVGDDMQAVVLTMTSGDEVRAEAGAMMFMTDGVTMDARMRAVSWPGSSGSCWRAKACF